MPNFGFVTELGDQRILDIRALDTCERLIALVELTFADYDAITVYSMSGRRALTELVRLGLMEIIGIPILASNGDDIIDDWLHQNMMVGHSITYDEYVIYQSRACVLSGITTLAVPEKYVDIVRKDCGNGHIITITDDGSLRQ